MSRCIVDVNEDYTMCGQYSREDDTHDYRESRCPDCRLAFDRRLSALTRENRKERDR